MKLNLRLHASEAFVDGFISHDGDLITSTGVFTSDVEKGFKGGRIKEISENTGVCLCCLCI